MVEVFGKNYYIDLDCIVKSCQIPVSNGTDTGDTIEINVFKYEMIKMCLDRVLSEFRETDEEMGEFGLNDNSASFKIAFNTLIKYDILIEDDE